MYATVARMNYANECGGTFNAPLPPPPLAWEELYLALFHNVVGVATREASTLEQVHHITLAAAHKITRYTKHSSDLLVCIK